MGEILKDSIQNDDFYEREYEEISDNHNENDLLIPKENSNKNDNEHFKECKTKDWNDKPKEEIRKRKLFFIVLFKYIKIKIHLFSFENSFSKKLSFNNFTLFSIGFINEFQSNVYKHKKFFRYFTYTTM